MNTERKRTFLHRLWFAVKFLEIRLRFVLLLLITALAVGYWDTIQNHIERWQRERMAGKAEKHGHATTVTQGEYEYFCPMHPFVVRDRPGKCPICGMDLSQRKKGEAQKLPSGTLARVQVSPERIMQSGIQVEPVLYRSLSKSIRSYGVVEADETRVSRIVARFPGRIDDLKINAVGLFVKKGQPVASIYSPKFLAASQEYSQALEEAKRKTADPQATTEEKRRAEKLTESARQRLALAGFTEGQLADIAAQGGVQKAVTL